LRLLHYGSRALALTLKPDIRLQSYRSQHHLLQIRGSPYTTYRVATVGELASVLGITHASVSQTRHSLERTGIIVSELDTADARRRRLVLTEAGNRLVDQLKPLWRAFEAAAVELTSTADQLIESLDRLDNALVAQSMFERIMQHVNPDTLVPKKG
ncbi:MAG: MarR family winged helix-turn-helix transcriptional regulator, partial [Arenimonas sp.]